MKRNLGKKYKLQCDIFLNFLKNESERIKINLIKIQEQMYYKRLKKLNLVLKNIAKKIRVRILKPHLINL